jgi:hypothetical protein
MKKFLLKLIPFLLFPIIIIITNYTKDPANLFNLNYESGIANYMIKGYNVTNLANYDERLLQKCFIERMKVAPGEIALGSSRIMQLQKKDVNNPEFINNGVSGATFEDELAIYDLYEKKGYNVKKVILNLEPWMLNDNHGQMRWKTLEKEYSEFVGKIYKSPGLSFKKSFFNINTEKYLELVSISYFQTSLDYLLKGINKEYKPTKQTINIGSTRLSDGAIFYDSKYRNASIAEIDAKATETISMPSVYSLGDFNQLSPHYEDVFIKFIDYLQSKNVKVEFYLSPFHPIVYNYLKEQKRYRNVFAAENYFRDIAKQRGIKVYGAYDPQIFNLNSTYFYDGLHCNANAIHKILEGDKN